MTKLSDTIPSPDDFVALLELTQQNVLASLKAANSDTFGSGAVAIVATVDLSRGVEWCRFRGAAAATGRDAVSEWSCPAARATFALSWPWVSDGSAILAL